MLNFIYTTQGLQSIGFLYSILPGLRELHKDDQAFAQSCARYSKHFNCNIFWAPFLSGVFLHMEREIASGSIPPNFVTPLKDTTLNTLSAVGDSFFSGSILVTIVLMMACLLVLGNVMASGVLVILWLLGSFVVKFMAFNIGLARGMSVLRYVRRINLINKGDYLKLFNAVLLCAFLAIVMGISSEIVMQPLGIVAITEIWLLPLTMILLLGYSISRVRLSRTLAIFVIVAVASIIL
jgi:PTS system mannose-specific IID component